MSTQVKVIISFATEDFVTPEHDEILIRLAEGLSKRGLVGNFHLTGQLARTVRTRGRTDVVEALREHEIGYHSNTHGARPFLAGILEDNTWDEGLAKVLPTEARGLRDVEEIMGKRAQYYTLEFIKAPQLIHAMRLLGIKQLGYSPIPTFGRAAVWMADVLCCGNELTLGMEAAPDTPDRLERMRAKFGQLYERARAGENDGVIRAFLHPYKLITPSTQSWGRINRLYTGEPLPDRDWQVPQCFDADITERLLGEHEAMLDHMASRTGVCFEPMSVLASMYAEQRPAFVPLATVAALAERVADRPTAPVVDGVSYSPAEVYGLIVGTLGHHAKEGDLPEAVPLRLGLGPVDDPARPDEDREVTTGDFLRACALEDGRYDLHGRMSSGFECAGAHIGPGTALVAAARLLLDLVGPEGLPEQVVVRPKRNLPEAADEAYFQEQTFYREGIYPDGFTGEAICRHCRLQSWSVRPAVCSLG